ATRLPDGRVLVEGAVSDWGSKTLNVTSELYDPFSGSWSPAEDMIAARADAYTATLLADGRVLVAGGRELNDSLASAELFAPRNGWGATGAMQEARNGHT